MVRMVVPDALMRVLSAGLSVVIFMYCADAAPAQNIEIRIPRTKCRTASLMHPSLARWSYDGTEESRGVFQGIAEAPSGRVVGQPTRRFAVVFVSGGGESHSYPSAADAVPA